SFRGVKRRLELLGDFGGVRLYDDFAHHPTAIRSTLEGLRATLHEAGSTGRVIVLVEARSNTMKAGYHQHTLAASFDPADEVLWCRSPQAKLDLDAIAREVRGAFQAFDSTEAMIDAVLLAVRGGDHVVVMSNGGFEGIHGRLAARLTERFGADRNSTRLNSSHVKISYAVFCLKKKNTTCPPHGVGGELTR